MVLEKTTQSSNFAESLRDMGERLRIIRLQKELDMEAIAQRTKIPTKHIAAIEAGDLDILPELIYVRGFVRRYAEALDQDVHSFDLGAVQAPNPVPSQPLSSQKLSFGALMRKLQYPLYALLVMGVGSGLIYLNNREFSPTPAQSSVETPVVGQTSSEP